MSSFINDLLDSHGLEPAGPPYWDEKAELWKIPVKNKVCYDELTEMPVTFELNPNWRENDHGGPHEKP